MDLRHTRPFKPRFNKNGVEKPWLKEKDPREKWVTILPLIGVVIGCGLAAFLGYNGWSSVETHKFCLVYEDNFDKFNNDVWQHEVQVGGFGTGGFEWTTADAANSYVVNNTLIIMPTLTDNFLTAEQVTMATPSTLPLKAPVLRQIGTNVSQFPTPLHRP